MQPSFSSWPRASGSIEALVAQPSVKALDVAVLHRASGLDVHQSDLPVLRPNARWFRTLNDVRNTLASWRQEYNWERPHSSLGYQMPEQFRQNAGYANVEGQPRLPHLHSHDRGYGIFPKPNLNRESPVMTG